MKILLILNKEKKINKLIIKKTKTLFKNVTIKYDDNVGFFKKKHYFDYVLSFLSKKILNKKFLSQTKILNINFHPGPPDYPGIGCYNFAIYNNEKYYGCTAHQINEKVDNGKILNVRKFKIKGDDVKSLILQTYEEMFLLFKEILISIKKNNLSFMKEGWKKKASTRKELNKLSLLNVKMSKSEIEKRIKATYFKRGFGPYLEYKKLKFELIKDE